MAYSRMTPHQFWPSVDSVRLLGQIDASGPVRNEVERREALTAAAAKIGATPAGLPGLWSAPGFPVLTDMQLLDVAGLSLTSL